MKFTSGTRRRAIEYEKALVEYWKEHKTFKKSVENRSADDAYVFYDGPPFITGVPHHGTLLTSIVKDAIPRYQTMKGKHVERVWGWDTHGLPAENFVEKKLGINDRHEIGTKISLADYVTTARESMIQTGDLWESSVDRIGRWVDFKGAYKTMDKDYMESVWWAFKELYNKGKIYEGEKVLMYDTQWATPLSKAEVTMDAGAYQVVTDPSVYVKFHLKSNQKYAHDQYETQGAVYILAWTTTPWTLPGNVALAVGNDVNYTALRIDGVPELLIVASDRVDEIFKDQEVAVVHDDIKGSDLVGLEYEPLLGEHRGENAHKVWAADFVTTESGTGIVHIAPAYGEDDFELARRNNIPVVHALDEYGVYTEGEWKGENVWAINKTIAKTLKERGVVWKIDYIQHEYPHNPRTGNRIMYRAHPSWFMDIDGQRTEMLEQNENVNWFPAHIKHGRFQKTVETAPDWNLSRDRFWASAMPVWKGVDSDGNEHVKVVGSYVELKELSGVELEDYHRPWVDDIEFDLDGVHYKRIDKVLDCWFESGSMPFAQFHYPFENKEKFEANFPGDFIVEYVGQVRAWFYYVHAVNVGIFGQNAFKNVIVHGNLMGNDGYKLSKSRGNFTDPGELMDEFSADSLRFLLLSSPVLNGEDFTLLDKDVRDVARKLSMIWNMYDFFTMYAEVDGWEFDSQEPFTLNPEDVTNPLDKWIVSRVHQLNEHVTKHMDDYNIPTAMSEFMPFIEDASNWFVRRSRRRFWKSEDDGDKAQAYRTLHYTLMKLAVIMAPFTPFLSEELYQKLGGGNESVHLLDWPTNYTVDQQVLDEMATVRDYVNQALSLRAAEKIKIRQPLASVTIPSTGSYVNFEDILVEELNVKKVIQGEKLELDFVITPELKREGLMREVVRHVQAARKAAGLNVDDRIVLALMVQPDDADELEKAIEEHSKAIAEETLTAEYADVQDGHDTTVKIEEHELRICLKKA